MVGSAHDSCQLLPVSRPQFRQAWHLVAWDGRRAIPILRLDSSHTLGTLCPTQPPPSLTTGLLTRATLSFRPCFLPSLLQELRLVGREDRIPVLLESGGGWDVLTVSPVEEQAGVRVAPLGLPHMLNTGGAVLGFKPGVWARVCHALYVS